jgi:phospholipid/cholesterol/gamma-HCH transport system substrate-binding protein
MVTQAPPRTAILVAVLFVIASIALSLFVWSSLGGEIPLQPKGYRLHATFSNASQLNRNADVRIAGIPVGKVIEVKPAGLRTDATIELQPKFAPIPVDTHAILRQKTLLGETFVVLSPGNRKAEGVPEGGSLAEANVAPTQPLDRVLGVLDDKTRRDIEALFTGSAVAFRGRGDDLNDALGNLGPVTDQFSAILGILDHQRGSLRGLVRDSGRVLRTIGDHRDAVREIVTAGSQVVSATASRDAALTDTVRALAPLTGTLRTTSAAITHTAGIAGPLLHDLKPVVPLLAPALESIRTLTPQIEAVLGDLDVALPVAAKALPATAHLVKGLRPFIAVLYPATREITPIINLVSRYRKELVATVANAAAANQATSPGIGGKEVHYLRSMVPVTEESLVGYEKRPPSNRHNAYFAPGELANLRKGGLLAADCRNTANPQLVPVIGTGAPPCKVQPPWSFGGATRYFPHVERVPAR